MAALTYLNNIPAASQRLRDSQPQIQTNFASIQTLIETDHVAFSDTNSGMHKALHIVDGVPAPALIAGQGSIYVDTNNVFIQNGTSTAVNLTSTTSSAAGGTGTEYTYVLPSGTVVKWKNYTGLTAKGNATENFTFDVAFPTACQNIQVSTITPAGRNGGDFSVWLNSFTLTGGQVYWKRNEAGGATKVPTFTYFAIGN